MLEKFPKDEEGRNNGDCKIRFEECLSIRGAPDWKEGNVELSDED